VDTFDDQFAVEEAPEALGLAFDEEPNFFPPESAEEEEDDGQPQQEESIYTDDPVRFICAKWVPYPFSPVRVR